MKTCIKCSETKTQDLFMKGRNICKMCKSLYDKKYREKRGEEYRAQKRQYYRDNKEKVLITAKRWKENNPEKAKLFFRNYRKNKFKTDINYRIKSNLRTRLGNAIKRGQKKGSAVRDLGCSIDFFKKYISKLFKKQMSWENYGIVWELDHIKPLCSFDLQDVEQLKKATHYTNLQPLFVRENRKKGGRYFDPAQSHS